MKVLIVDDENLARDRLRRLVDGIGGYTVCGEAATGRSAIEEVGRLEPDVLLMDIRMPDMDGLEAARHLGTLDCPPAVIFTTAYADHALSAFETQAVDYLLKPIRQARLAAALAQSRRLTRAQLEALHVQKQPVIRTHICVRQRGKLQLVPVDEVRFFRAEHKYVTVRAAEGREVLIEDSLKSLEDEFGTRFVRTHRNTLVGQAFIAGLEKTPDARWQLRLSGIDEPLEISRRHLAEVRRRIKRSTP
jgi:two-component system response regulator AlgR